MISKELAQLKSNILEAATIVIGIFKKMQNKFTLDTFEQ